MVGPITNPDKLLV